MCTVKISEVQGLDQFSKLDSIWSAYSGILPLRFVIEFYHMTKRKVLFSRFPNRKTSSSLKEKVIKSTSLLKCALMPKKID